MKRIISYLLIFSFIFTLLIPVSGAQSTVFSRDPYISQDVYSPAKNNCIYIYVPLSGSNISCTVTIYDGNGLAVYRSSRGGLSTNVQTFIWDGRPAKGNSASYDPNAFAPSGQYTAVIEAGRGNDLDRYTLGFYVSGSGNEIFDEVGIPNYTGNAVCDYLAELILSEIDLDGKTNYEKYEAIYTWVQANGYRENSKYILDFDSGCYYDIDSLSYDIEEYSRQADIRHELGYINYDVNHSLESRRALDMILYRVGTCYEFSALVQILLEHIGIESYVYGGYFHNSNGSVVIHKWNYFRLNGTYYWSDVRIDNASYERTDRTTLFFDYLIEENTSTWKKRHSWDENVFISRSTAAEPITEYIAPINVSNDIPGGAYDPEKNTGSDRSPFIYEGDEIVYTLSQFTDMSPRRSTTASASLSVSGEGTYHLEAYNIDGFNYFKLRDIAYVLSGTDSQFNVGWDEYYNRITLTSYRPYEAVSGELVNQGLKDPMAVPTGSEIILDGEKVELAAYFINESNYFKLRDLAILFDFYVGWDESANMMIIDPSCGYSE